MPPQPPEWEQVPDPQTWTELSDDILSQLYSKHPYLAALARRPLNYMLAPDGRTPIPVETLEWARWYGTPEGRKAKIVAQTKYRGYWISTVFLGLDHAYGGGPPILWETMIFFMRDRLRQRRMRRHPSRRLAELQGRRNRPSRRYWSPGYRLDGWQDRYTSYEAALAGHSSAVRTVRSLYG